MKSGARWPQSGPRVESASSLQVCRAACQVTVSSFAALFVLAALGCEPIVLDFDTPTSAPSNSPGGAPNQVPEPPPAPELIVSRDLDLTRETPSGRDCPKSGEMATYFVDGADAGALMLEEAPSDDCLLPGDELLLIELQSESLERVGQHELLRVRSVQGARVELVSGPLLAYGSGATGRWSAAGAKIVVQRVPSFSRITVNEGAVLTARAFRDGGSGVFSLRVLGDLVVEGAIRMNASGFRGGEERLEVLEHGLQGESILGLGTSSTEPNRGGGGGGLGDQMRSACVQDGNAGGGGGHAEPGRDATVNDLCDGEGRGRGGSPYARSGRLFLGSGGGSGGVDNVRVDNPPGAAGGDGGGMIWVLAQSVSGGGRIEARGGDGVGDEPGVECVAGGSQTDCYDHSGPGGAGAGGSIRLTTTQLSGVILDVDGGQGGNGRDDSTGNGGDGGRGLIEAPGT